MLYSYYLGLDLGQTTDYTALTIIEEPVWAMREWRSPAKFSSQVLARIMAQNYHEGRPPFPPLQLRHLERFELGTPYPHIVSRVGAIMQLEPLASRPCVLLVDKTGVGAAVVDMFEAGWLHPVSVTIHGGSAVTLDTGHRGYRVPKRDLVGSVQVLLQNHRLQIASALPMAEVLRKELMNFRMKIDPRTAHDSYEHWREGMHDDLVLSTAIACWYRQWYQEHLEMANTTSPIFLENEFLKENGAMTYEVIEPGTEVKR